MIQSILYISAESKKGWLETVVSEWTWKFILKNRIILPTDTDWEKELLNGNIYSSEEHTLCKSLWTDSVKYLQIIIFYFKFAMDQWKFSFICFLWNSVFPT